MHKIILITCFTIYQFIFIPAEAFIATNESLLLLHLDVNKTLIAEDKVKNQTVENVITFELAKRAVHQWDPQFPPMSYYDYVSKVLVSGPRNASLKEKRNKILSEFMQTLENSDYQGKNELIVLYHSCMKKMEGKYLIPSFVKFLRHLKQRNINFRLILRTYGDDVRVGSVVKEIEKVLDGGRFKFSGSYQSGVLNIKGMESINDAQEAYRFFRETEGHVAIQDDWKIWIDDEEKSRSGKPFVFDPEDKKIVSLFIDDNINPEPDSEYNIVNLIPINSRKGCRSEFHSSYLRKVDTIEAILDEDYFLKLIRI